MQHRPKETKTKKDNKKSMGPGDNEVEKEKYYRKTSRVRDGGNDRACTVWKVWIYNSVDFSGFTSRGIFNSSELRSLSDTVGLKKPWEPRGCAALGKSQEGVFFSRGRIFSIRSHK